MDNKKLDSFRGKNLAPVGVSLYKRRHHLARTVEALAENALAKESHIYFFSDGPKPGDENEVREIREYLSSVDFFRTVTIVCREKNDRPNNNRGGINLLLDKYGKAIFLEEDNLVSPSFLRFMNDALNYYQEHIKVIAVSGKSYFEKCDLKCDVYKTNSHGGKGLGFWRKKFHYFPGITLDNFIKDIRAPTTREKLLQLNDSMLYSLLPKQIYGDIDAGDVLSTYYMTINDLFAIRPSVNLVEDIGADGSGCHAAKTHRTVRRDLMDRQFSLKPFSEIPSFPHLYVNKKKQSTLSKLKIVLRKPRYGFNLIVMKLRVRCLIMVGLAQK